MENTSSKTEHLMDIARYGGVIGHLSNNPDIHTFIMVADKGTPIHVVGDAMVDGDMEVIKSMMETGTIKVCANMQHGDLGFIPRINSVECLYLPPIYLVKDRGVPHI